MGKKRRERERKLQEEAGFDGSALRKSKDDLRANKRQTRRLEEQLLEQQVGHLLVNPEKMRFCFGKVALFDSIKTF